MILIKKTYEIQREEAIKKLLVIDNSKKNKISYNITFDEEVMFFKERDKLLTEFTKFIMHMISIPIRAK